MIYKETMWDFILNSVVKEYHFEEVIIRLWLKVDLDVLLKGQLKNREQLF
jgi:hypothetical protein